MPGHCFYFVSRGQTMHQLVYLTIYYYCKAGEKPNRFFLLKKQGKAPFSLRRALRNAAQNPHTNPPYTLHTSVLSFRKEGTIRYHTGFVFTASQLFSFFGLPFTANVSPAFSRRDGKGPPFFVSAAICSGKA